MAITVESIRYHLERGVLSIEDTAWLLRERERLQNELLQERNNRQDQVRRKRTGLAIRKELV